MDHAHTKASAGFRYFQTFFARRVAPEEEVPPLELYHHHHPPSLSMEMNGTRTCHVMWPLQKGEKMPLFQQRGSSGDDISRRFSYPQGHGTLASPGNRESVLLSQRSSVTDGLSWNMLLSAGTPLGPTGSQRFCPFTRLQRDL